MGFRSNFITEDYYSEIPQWFVNKYPYYKYQVSEGKYYFAIAQLWEAKFYGVLAEDERFLDIQRIIQEIDLSDGIALILLHECGGITRVKITKDRITATEPTDWEEVESVEHSYCYGCSDIAVAESQESSKQ